MKLEIFTSFDSKAQAFTRPFFAPSKGEATRSFGDAINDITCPFGKHPEDYSLWHIGTFDDSNATVELLTAPIELIKGIDYIDQDYRDYLAKKTTKETPDMQNIINLNQEQK